MLVFSVVVYRYVLVGVLIGVSLVYGYTGVLGSSGGLLYVWFGNYFVMCVYNMAPERMVVTILGVGQLALNCVLVGNACAGGVPPCCKCGVPTI